MPLLKKLLIVIGILLAALVVWGSWELRKTDKEPLPLVTANHTSNQKTNTPAPNSFKELLIGGWEQEPPGEGMMERDFDS